MKVLSYILVAVIAFVVAIAITKNDAKSTDEYDFSNISDTPVEYQESSKYTTYYDQLTDYQKSIYDSLLNTIKNQDKSVVLKNVNIADFKQNCFRATTAIQYDHPEYFWYTGGYSYTQKRVMFEELGEIEFEPIYYEYANSFFDAKDKSERLEREVKKVADLARQYSSDPYMQITFVHDYLIQNSIYDYDALEDYYKTNRSPSCEYIFSAYGCLVNGKTVCSGYAKAYQLVTRELGFDCTYVTGDAGEAHGWNCIYIDGKGYYVDVTWDDPDRKKEVPRYDYAFITGKELSKTHTVDNDFEEPVCVSDKFNYFHYYGYYLDTYNYTGTSTILSAQSNCDAAYIRYGSLKELEKAYKDLVTTNNYKKIPGLNNFKEYYLNEDYYILGFYK